MVEVSQEMVGLEVASAELDKLMSADAAADQAAQAPTADRSANLAVSENADTHGQRAARTGPDQGTKGPKDQGTKAETETDPGKFSKQTDTPAAAEGQRPEDRGQRPDQQKPDTTKDREPSRFEKNRQRQESAWKQINEEKAALRAEREQLAARTAELERTRAESEPRYSPEQYERAAAEFERQGKFDLAEAAREQAAELRRNPPPAPQQAELQRRQQAEHQAAMKEWWGKAAVDYPNVAKEGSPEHGALKTFLQAEPEAVRSPKGMYYAARLVSAETAAARVPAMEKELGELRAKVKELEALTLPGGPSIPPRQGQAAPASEEQQFAELERLAMEMGTLR